MKKRIRRVLRSTAFRGLVSVALIAAVIASIDRAQFAAALRSVPVAGFLALIAIDLVLRMLSAYRWHVLFTGLHPHAPLMETTKISFVASFLGQALPGVIGVEALRVYGLAKSSNDSAAAFASVVTDRVFGLFSLVIVIFLGLMVGPQALQQMVLVPTLLSLLLLVAGVLVFINARSRQWALHALPAVLRDRIEHWAADVFSCFDRYKTHGVVLSVSLVLSVLFQFLRVVLFFVAALILGESPAFVYFVALVPIVMFAALLPISISGLGVREASLVVFFTHFGVMDGAQAFTVSILVFVSGLISALPGGWYYFGHRDEIREIADHA